MVGNILRRGGISAAAAATAAVGVVNFLSNILREYLFVYMYIYIDGLYTHHAYNNIIILFHVSSLSITPGASLFNRVDGENVALVAVIYNWFSSVTPRPSPMAFTLSWTPPEKTVWRLRRTILLRLSGAATVHRLPREAFENLTIVIQYIRIYHYPSKTAILRWIARHLANVVDRTYNIIINYNALTLCRLRVRLMFSNLRPRRACCSIPKSKYYTIIILIIYYFV